MQPCPRCRSGWCCLLVLKSGFVVDPIGGVASLGAVTMASLGFVLVKRWRPPVDLLAFTSWQLVVGGLLLLPVALLVEGGPPSLSARNVGGFIYLAVISTGLAYVCWFRGLQRMEAGAVALIGLLNPVVGTLLGVFIAHESFGPGQLIGMMLVFSGIAAGQPSVGVWLQQFRARRTAHRRNTVGIWDSGEPLRPQTPVTHRGA